MNFPLLKSETDDKPETCGFLIQNLIQNDLIDYKRSSRRSFIRANVFCKTFGTSYLSHTKGMLSTKNNLTKN